MKPINKYAKQDRYKDNMLKMGFIKFHTWIHQDDLEDVKAYIARKRKRRISHEKNRQ